MLTSTYAVQLSTDMAVDPEHLKRVLRTLYPDLEIHRVEWMPNGPNPKPFDTGVIEPLTPSSSAIPNHVPTSFIHRIKG